MAGLLVIVWILSLSAALLAGWVFCAGYKMTEIADLHQQIDDAKHAREWEATQRAMENADLSPLPFVRAATPTRFEKVRSCKQCGCTEDRACAGGCAWVAPELCSACAVKNSRAA